MKLKMNKACDLSSISVFPPHARKASALPSGTEPSIFNSSNRSQASQLRSQQSQQSLSQSQHGMFSQFSQNSLDDVVVNDQRFGSQERENSTKMISCLPPSNYTREDSQMQMSRTSTNLMRQWKPAVLDQRCQITEELGHKIGVIETSLSRFGKILDSVQSDIMQVNKGTKEVALEMESIRQKLIVHDNSLQLTNKGQEDIKASFEGGLKSISDQLNQNIFQDSLKEISSLLSGLPEKIEAYILKLQNDLCKTLTREIQGIACSLRIPNQKLIPTVLPPKAISYHTASQEMPPLKKVHNQSLTPTVLPSKALSYRATLQEMPPLENPPVHSKIQQSTLVPKVEMGTWNSVKHEQACTDRGSNHVHKRKGHSPIEQGTEWRVIIESDEELDGVFSCLLEEKETGKKR